MAKNTSLLLGELLLAQHLITAEQLDAALIEQKKTGDFLGTVLLRLGYLNEAQLYPVLSKQLGVRYVKIDQLKINAPLLKKVPAKFACHYKFMPLELKGKTLTVGVADPLDMHVLDDIKLLLGYEVIPVLSSEQDVLDAIQKHYGIGAETVEKIIAETEKEPASARVGQKTEDVGAIMEDASIIKFVNEILLQAYKDRATDIHIEPFEDELKIRYRIDGVLYNAAVPSTLKHLQSTIVSRIKIMSNLNIAEKRLPQDGRIKIRIGGEDLDLRVSILPTPHGESVDIRVLSSLMLYSLENLGLLKKNHDILEEMIKKPHGIIFVTGPTGSGKTTTLYACLSKINSNEKKILTIEDPIEYQIKGITQIQVLPKIGLDFAAGLRSMLRHDPDIMMVGEVRDYETAEITIRVSLTGHLVFSTLHTNDASGAVTRLLDMGIEPYLAASSVECIIAQRLVRLICNKCRHELAANPEIAKELGMPPQAARGVKIYKGKGCEECKFTGYKGRTAIYEILVVNEEIRDLVLKRASADQIKKKAISMGMKTLRHDGWEKIKMGLTTPSEVIRVSEEI